MAKKPGAVGVILFAVILGLVSAYLIWAYFAKLEDTKNRVAVVSATVDINPHVTITGDMVTDAIAYPKDLIPDNAITDKKQVEGRITLRHINAKDPIRSTDLVQEGQSPTLALEIPKGMRAISIGAGEVMAVGTSVKPGDHVDILATYQDPRSQQELTKIIMQNVLILAVNKGQTDVNGKEGANSSMTLAVKPEETELIAMADRAGALRVSLRPVGDQQTFDSPGVSAKDFKGFRPPPETIIVTNEIRQPPVFTPMPVPAPRGQEIKVIHGTTEQIISP
jgi:pilus assembly protein CpaB